MNAPTSKSLAPTSTAYADTAIKLAPLACPYCTHELRAVDVELLGGGEYRLICPNCHVLVLTIEG